MNTDPNYNADQSTDEAESKREKIKDRIAKQIRGGANWQSFAECAKRDPEEFNENRFLTAKKICDTLCLVKDACFQDAYNLNDTGEIVRAGMKGDMRRHEFSLIRAAEKEKN